MTLSTLIVLVLFQNCGPQFQTVESTASLTSLETGATTPADQGDVTNPPPTQNLNPQITAPTTPLSVGMNVPFKIVIPITDSDTDTSLINYIIRTSPQNGTLALDAGSVDSANRGVTYTPNTNFIGQDSFTLNVVDPQGNLGPDQRFNLSVDTKGIGQLLGYYGKRCVPNVSPTTFDHDANLQRFTLIQRAFTQDCSTLIYTFTMSGQHSIGLENVMTGSNVTGFEYNIQNANTSVTPASAAAAQTLNAQNFCGFNNWVANVRRDLVPTGCNGTWAGRNLYMYRRVEFPAVGSPRLFISSSVIGGNGSTPQTRSRGLELNMPLIRNNAAN